MAEEVILVSSDSSTPVSPSRQNFDDDTIIYSPHVSRQSDEANLSGLLAGDCGTESFFNRGIGFQKPHTPVSRLANSHKSVHSLSDSEESDTSAGLNSDEEFPTIPWPCKTSPTFDKSRRASPPNKIKRFEGKTFEGKERLTKEEVKERKKIERDIKRAEKEKNKVLKAVVAEALRANKPGECLKYIHVMLDQQLLTAEYGGELLVALQGAELQYNIQNQSVPLTVTWTREVRQHHMDENMKMHMSSELQEEGQVLIVRSWKEIINLAANRELCAHIQAIQTVLPNKTPTLVVYGTEQYFRFQKKRKNCEMRGQVLGVNELQNKPHHMSSVEELPRVTRQILEEVLAEVQLFTGCCVRLVESPPELGALVVYFTKAVAEMPFKLERQQKDQTKLDWFALADSKDCVRVDKNGHGLQRLWRQQLCQFNLATLETAEAISSKYQCPQALIQAYNCCSSQKNAELLLQDIPIRRGLGPLTSIRRVGQELSKKVHLFFTTKDGEALLSQE